MYLYIVLGNYGLKKSLSAYYRNLLPRGLIIEFRLDFAIRIVVSVIKKQFRRKLDYNIIRPI